jgi:hypothetical protein
MAQRDEQHPEHPWCLGFRRRDEHWRVMEEMFLMRAETFKQLWKDACGDGRGG